MTEHDAVAPATELSEPAWQNASRADAVGTTHIRPIALVPLLSVAALLAALAALFFYSGNLNGYSFSATQTITRALPDTFWAMVTVCGSGLGAFALLSLALQRRPIWVAAALATAPIAGAYSNIIKRVVALPRPAAVLSPDQIHVIGETLRSNSFPSGHAVTAFALAATIVFASRRPRVVALWMVPLAILIALSRIAVGAHWPADLAGGAAGGWLSGACGVLIVDRWRRWNTPTGIRVMGLVMVGVGIALLTVDLGYPLAHLWQWALGCVAIVSGLFALFSPRVDLRWVARVHVSSRTAATPLE